jgi:hypothetical protein
MALDKTLNLLTTPLDELEKALGFDPKTPCIYCEQPVERLSMGGALVCPACDCGYYRSDHPDKSKRGKPWRGMDAVMFLTNARARLAPPTAEDTP